MGTKVEVRTIPLYGLFIHRKQVWRSLGKLRAESHSTTAQKVFMNEHNTEVSTENADYYAFYNADDKFTTAEYGYTRVHYSLRPATDSEKQQLFDALAKKGKTWDAEKKQIVDLKPKFDELKPFDNVLVRHQKTEEWRANIFSHTDKTDEYLDYVCVNGRWEFCIPYEGNESLLGTTKDVEG